MQKICRKVPNLSKGYFNVVDVHYSNIYYVWYFKPGMNCYKMRPHTKSKWSTVPTWWKVKSNLTETTDDLREALGGSRPVHTGGLAGQGGHQPGQQLLQPIIHMTFKTRGSQIDVVYICYLIAPKLGEGFWGACEVSANEYSCSHGAQINLIFNLCVKLTDRKCLKQIYFHKGYFYLEGTFAHAAHHGAQRTCGNSSDLKQKFQDEKTFI